ncbi:MAG: hypothetical protein ACK6BG_13545 [Cyanobacteriota bacterium]
MVIGTLVVAPWIRPLQAMACKVPRGSGPGLAAPGCCVSPPCWASSAG